MIVLLSEHARYKQNLLTEPILCPQTFTLPITTGQFNCFVQPESSFSPVFPFFPAYRWLVEAALFCNVPLTEKCSFHDIQGKWSFMATAKGLIDIRPIRCVAASRGSAAAPRRRRSRA